MELRHLRYFIAVVEEGSFLRAAERLHISQPPLSTQIKNLEEELGAQLLERSARGVQQTAAGRVLYAEATAILARVQHARLRVRHTALGEEGSLSIGFVSIADYSFLPAALKQFRTKFPAIDLQLHELTSDAQVRELLTEKLDLGIALAPLDDPGLVFHPLLKEKLVIALPSGHALAKRRRAVSLKALAAESFIFVPRHMAPGLHDIIISFCRQCGFAPRISQYAKQMQTVVSLVSSGFGVALVPQSVQNLKRTGVVYAATSERSPSIQIGLMHRSKDENPAIERFLSTVQEIAQVYAAKSPDTKARSRREGSATVA